MITSICPKAATARIVMYGRTYAHEVFWIARGAMIEATTTSTPVASHTGRKRAATAALATNVLPGAVTAVLGTAKREMEG
jgi:hypothetical protein